MELIEQVLLNSFDTIFVLDHDLKITDWNLSMTYLIGLTKSEVLGKDIFEVIPSLEAECEYYFRQAVLRENRTIEIQLQEFLTPKSKSKTYLKAKYFQTDNGGMMGIWRQLPSFDQAERDYLNLLKSVIVNTNDAILVTKAGPTDQPTKRNIIYVNPAFTKMTGYSEKEMLGRTPRILQGEKTDKADKSEIVNALKNWRPINRELLNYAKDGREFWVDLDIVPVANEEGVYTHWIAIQRETTEKKLNEVKLKSLKNQLERRVKERTIDLEKFIHFIAHDIKEPIRTMKSHLGQLSESKNLKAEQLEQANDALSSAQSVCHMIDRLMEFTEARSSTLKLERIGFENIIHGAMKNLSLLIAESGAVIELDEMPAVEIDTILMMNVMQNLISNAINYCDEDTVPHISIVSDVAESYQVISVKDNGRGMMQSKQDEIFNILEHIKASFSTNATGLGLSICRSIIEKHHGKIEVHSVIGEGSTFHIFLPKVSG